MQSAAYSPLDRFLNAFMPHVDQRYFDVSIFLEGTTIRLHLNQVLPKAIDEAKIHASEETFRNFCTARSIGDFYAAYRDEMLEAIVQAGEEIQLFQISCEERSFKAYSARNLIEALQDRYRVGQVLDQNLN